MIASSSRAGVVIPKKSGTAAAALAGSVSDEQFRASFESVPIINFSSTKELIAECQKQSAILENTNNDWSKRAKSLQSIRSLLVSGAANNAEFVNQCYTLLGTALQNSVKDLRSQVCREACITVAFFCEKMGTAFWRIAEMIIPTTMILVQNSAKVMASSAINANHYMAKYVRNPKIVSLFMSFSFSKSKDIRRCTIGLISDIIGHWEAHTLEKSWPEIMQSLKTGIHDADVETRVCARQAFESLQALYPQRADFLFQELEPAKQRMLVGRSSTASSTHSINSERDNLQISNRGLYTAQQIAFLSKRSTSDLNHSIHSIRKLNLGISHNRPVIHRPNVIRSTKPPQSSLTPLKPNVTDSPVSKKTLPLVRNSTSNVSDKSCHKSSSQPGSRSASPNRFRPPRSHLAHSNDKKVTHNGNGGLNAHTNTNSAFSTTRHHATTNSTPAAFQRDVVRALKNVDMQARNLRPNIVRHDEDQGFMLSPTTGFVNRIAPAGNSPIGDYYGNARHNTNRYKIDEESPNGKHVHANGNNGNNDVTKWYKTSQSLSNNLQEQEKYVTDFCKLLQNNNGNNRNEKEIEAALYSLSHKIRDGAIMQWDDFFGPIFLTLLHTISQYNNHAIKLSALRTLKDLCQCQPQRLVQKPELAMLNVLNAHDCEDATVVRVAEDCAAALALHLPIDVCMKLLITVIDDENTAYHQLSGAIKMLSRVIEKILMEEVQQLLPTVVPRMMKCYENSQSVVRRASIICLVAISNAIGMNILKPHLNASTLKLVEVYRDRMAKGK